MSTLRSITLALSIAASATVAHASQSIQVFPSGPTVPENLLRIELRFSIPLEPPLNIQNLKLMDASGSEVKDAFLDLPLPSPDDRRVTILFHPGRVKTGVGANLALGRALQVGQTVTLIVDHPALGKSVRKTWRVTAFDAQSPQPALWKFQPPSPGTRSPFWVRLDKPISSASEDLIAIRGPDGQRFAGTAHLERGETVWRFTPARPWQAGSYALVIHPDLEDAAGNRPGALFEEKDTGGAHSEEETAEPFKLTKH